MPFPDYLSKWASTQEITLSSHQKKLAQAFENFDQHLRHLTEKNSYFSIIKNKTFPPSPFKNPPRGLYIWGEVGRGKTMIMDQYQAYLTLLTSQKFHFYDFMKLVHTHLQDLRKSLPKKKDFKERIFIHYPHNERNSLLHQVAQTLTQSFDILFFDEFFVDNIGDAMILGPLLKEILTLRKFIVITSNFSPESLYEKGLNREAFLPFIDLLKKQLEVVNVEGLVDYREAKGNNSNHSLYFFPESPAHERKLLNIFNSLSGYPPLETPPSGSYKGEKILWLDFNDYFSKPTSAEDYEKLASQFPIFILSRIPQLTDEKIDKAKRFMIFIDILYKRKCPLIGSGECDISELYNGILLGKEMKRTLSRLKEMQSWEI